MAAAIKGEVMASAITATAIVTGESIARCCKRTGGQHKSRGRRSEDQFVHRLFLPICVSAANIAGSEKDLRECFNWRL
jgi:hypothetical protein